MLALLWNRPNKGKYGPCVIVGACIKQRHQFAILGIFCIWYSQTCPNNHPYITTTWLRQPAFSPPKPIPIQLLFSVLQMNKKLSKTATINVYQAKKHETMYKKYTRLYLLFCHLIIHSSFTICFNLCNINIRDFQSSE